jgi:hypothetical protein
VSKTANPPIETPASTCTLAQNRLTKKKEKRVYQVSWQAESWQSPKVRIHTLLVFAPRSAWHRRRMRSKDMRTQRDVICGGPNIDDSMCVRVSPRISRLFLQLSIAAHRHHAALGNERVERVIQKLYDETRWSSKAEIMVSLYSGTAQPSTELTCGLPSDLRSLHNKRGPGLSRHCSRLRDVAISSSCGRSGR